MISKFSIFCFVSCFCFISEAQDVLLFSDARSESLGGICALNKGWWSCFSNPAGLAHDNSKGFGLNYSNYYGIPETSSGAFALNIGVKPGNMGIGFISTGFGAINENKAALAYAQSVGRKLKAGIAINWLHYSQPGDYRDLYAWIPTVGLQWHPGEKWHAAISLANPTGQEYIPSGYRKLNRYLATGATFNPSEDFLILIEIQSVSHHDMRYVVGIETSPVDFFVMRLAVSRQYYFMYAAGIGFSKNRVSADVTVSHHPVLGLSPSTSLNFKF